MHIFHIHGEINKMLAVSKVDIHSSIYSFMKRDFILLMCNDIQNINHIVMQDNHSKNCVSIHKKL